MNSITRLKYDNKHIQKNIFSQYDCKSLYLIRICFLLSGFDVFRSLSEINKMGSVFYSILVFEDSIFIKTICCQLK